MTETTPGASPPKPYRSLLSPGGIVEGTAGYARHRRGTRLLPRSDRIGPSSRRIPIGKQARARRFRKLDREAEAQFRGQEDPTLAPPAPFDTCPWCKNPGRRLAHREESIEAIHAYQRKIPLVELLDLVAFKCAHCSNIGCVSAIEIQGLADGSLELAWEWMHPVGRPHKHVLPGARTDHALADMIQRLLRPPSSS